MGVSSYSEKKNVCRRGEPVGLEDLEEGTDPNINVREGANVLQATFSLVCFKHTQAAGRAPGVAVTL